jgi:hypothetical protein
VSEDKYQEEDQEKDGLTALKKHAPNRICESETQFSWCIKKKDVGCGLATYTEGKDDQDKS